MAIFNSYVKLPEGKMWEFNMARKSLNSMEAQFAEKIIEASRKVLSVQCPAGRWADFTDKE